MKVKEVSGNVLLSLRGKRSREVIAHELRRRGHGTDAKAIWRYETGRNQPSARVLPDYAEVLGASIDELYGDAPAEEEGEPRLSALDVYLRQIVAEQLAEVLRGQVRA